jgi:transcriptional regulator with XRE-family HTH domain
MSTADSKSPKEKVDPHAMDQRRADVARRLRTAREMAGLSQGQVARMLQIHRPSVSEAEAGRRRVPAEELSELAKIYGVSVNWLSGFGEDKLDPGNPRVELAARELGKLKPEDLNRVLQLLAALRSEPGTNE